MLGSKGMYSYEKIKENYEANCFVHKETQNHYKGH